MNMNFQIIDGDRVYSGCLKVNEGAEPCTLPMMVNSLLIQVAEDHPEIHQAESIHITAKLMP